MTPEQLILILNLLSNGKLPSQLLELLTLDTDNNYLVLNNGLNDAKKIKIPLLRGFKGSYNANTNTPSLTNGVGLDGDMHLVSVAGSRDFGAGTVNLLVDDIIIYLNGKYLKTSANTSDQDSIEISNNKFTLRKHPSNTNPAALEVNDMICNGWWGTTEFWRLAVYVGGATTNAASWNVIDTIEEIPLN
jgi:hypothetical protein